MKVTIEISEQELEPIKDLLGKHRLGVVLGIWQFGIEDIILERVYQVAIAKMQEDRNG